MDMDRIIEVVSRVEEQVAGEEAQ
jgi:hypothetical protein